MQHSILYIPIDTFREVYSVIMTPSSYFYIVILWMLFSAQKIKYRFVHFVAHLMFLKRLVI